MKYTLSIALTALLCSTGVAAQEVFMPQSIEGTYMPLDVPSRLEEPAFLMAAPSQLPLSGGDTLMFTQLELAGPSDVVLGKPYSARLTVETHQPLIDGNTIAVERYSRIYRDGEGRTRRDDKVGPPESQQAQVFIADPVAGTSYVLDPARRLAEQTSNSPQISPSPSAAQEVASLGETNSSFDVTAPTLVAGGGALATDTNPQPPQFAPGIPIKLPFPGEPQIVNLGERVIEGLNATGIRSIVTIPAHAIGNRSPIEIVTEQWYSAELNLVLLSEHRDPRVGETRYRLEDIRRENPDPKLFSVPADYTFSVPAR